MLRIILASFIATAMHVSTVNASETESEARGKAFAEKNCANCHAVGKEGASKLPIAPPFRTLGEKYPVENLEEALAEGIITAHPAMPVFQLEPPQIVDLIEYLNSLKP